MEKNTQLPAEVVNKIEQEAHDATCALYSPNNYDEFTSFRSGWEKGATAYAPWKVKYDDLCERFKEQDQAMFALQQELSQLKAQPSPRWVKAVEFKHEVGMPYHAKDSRFKGAGHFNGNGAFIWGDCTVTHPKDQDDLYLLDEQPAAGREEDAVAFAEELWDNHSVLIGEDIFTLEQYANREVMKKDDFMKAIAAFKQNNP